MRLFIEILVKLPSEYHIVITPQCRDSIAMSVNFISFN